MKFHDASGYLPWIPETEFTELVEDIRQNGLIEAIKLFDGKILDGRNRYKACQQLGIDPRYVTLKNIDPYLYVASVNLKRRNLTNPQRFLINLELHEKSVAWQKERQAIQDAANQKRSEATKQQPRERGGKFGTGPGTTSAGTGDAPRNYTAEDSAKTSTALAKLTGTDRGTVGRMIQLRRERPDLAEQVKEGTLKATEALRRLKKDKVASKVADLPPDKYRIIYADPPWQYNDSRSFEQASSSAAAHHYPTMKTSDICALDIKSLAADDGVLFMWATFPMLEDAMKVVQAWGFKYKTAIVWWKQRPNMGNYHNASAELLLIATKGSCTPDTRNRPDQVQAIKREGKHSEKPEKFREMIDQLYPHGPRIELFRRGDVPTGWVVWGNEVIDEVS